MRVKEGQSPAEESLHLDVENHQPTASMPGVTRYHHEVKEQKQNLVSTVQRSLVVHAYRTQRARPLTNRRENTYAFSSLVDSRRFVTTHHATVGALSSWFFFIY